MTLGEKLKMLRASRGLSQEQLAAELNVSRQAVSKWECGDAAPDLDKLRAICTYFAVTTDYLIWENEEDAPKAAVPEKERAVRGRNEVFGDALLLVLLLAGIAALWSSLRLGFASRAALHIVLPWQRSLPRSFQRPFGSSGAEWSPCSSPRPAQF